MKKVSVKELQHKLGVCYKTALKEKNHILNILLIKNRKYLIENDIKVYFNE